MLRSVHNTSPLLFFHGHSLPLLCYGFLCGCREIYFAKWPQTAGEQPAPPWASPGLHGALCLELILPSSCSDLGACRAISLPFLIPISQLQLCSSFPSLTSSPPENTQCPSWLNSGRGGSLWSSWSWLCSDMGHWRFCLKRPPQLHKPCHINPLQYHTIKRYRKNKEKILKTARSTSWLHLRTANELKNVLPSPSFQLSFRISAYASLLNCTSLNKKQILFPLYPAKQLPVSVKIVIPS